MDPSEVYSRPPPTPNRGRTGYNRKERSSSRCSPLDTHLVPSSHPRPQSSSLLVDTMPELTFSFDAPLEANRVSSEDTQA
jgi:hypothetical protein